MKELFYAVFILLPITLFCTALATCLDGGSWIFPFLAGVGMIILWAVGAVFFYVSVRASYYVWFVFYRVWVVIFGAIGLSFSLFGIFDYFSRLTKTGTGDPYHISRGGDILLYLVSSAVFTAILVWGIGKLRFLSFQRQLEPSQASLTLEYRGEVQAEQNFSDRGNHAFQLKFLVEPFVDALPVLFVALERLEEGRGTNVAWTSQRLRPVRPLGLAADPTGSTRLGSGNRLRRCIMRNNQALYAMVYARDGEKWFASGSQFRAVAYVAGGGYVSAVTRIRTSDASIDGANA